MKNKQIKRWPSLRGPPVQSPSNGLVKEHYTAKNSIPALYLDTHSPRLSTVPQKLTNSSPPPPPLGKTVTQLRPFYCCDTCLALLRFVQVPKRLKSTPTYFYFPSHAGLWKIRHTVLPHAATEKN